MATPHNAATGPNRIKDDGFFDDVKLPPGFEERTEVKLFKFERPGSILEGHVAGFLRGTIGGKPSVSIFIALEGKPRFVKIHATRQMLEKILVSDSGYRVRIIYKGESEIQTVGNPMRLFSVQINRKEEPRTDLLMDTSLLQMLQDEGD